MIGCLILSHGRIATAMVEACEKITGDCESLYTLSCDDQTPKGLREKVTHLIESENLEEGLFVFVSLKGGSCWNAVAVLLKDYENIQLISGLNLPVILSFITKREKYEFGELGDVLYDDAIRGINHLN